MWQQAHDNSPVHQELLTFVNKMPIQVAVVATYRTCNITTQRNQIVNECAWTLCGRNKFMSECVCVAVASSSSLVRRSVKNTAARIAYVVNRTRQRKCFFKPKWRPSHHRKTCSTHKFSTHSHTKQGGHTLRIEFLLYRLCLLLVIPSAGCWKFTYA